MPQVVGPPTKAFATFTNGTLTVPVPEDYQDNDYLVVSLRSQASQQSAMWTSPGWTQFGPFLASSANARSTSMMIRKVTGAQPASYGFTANLRASQRVVGVMFIVRGVDPDNPIAGISDPLPAVVTNGRTVVEHPISTPSLVIFTAGSEFVPNNSSNPIAKPSGFAEVQNYSTEMPISATRTGIWVGARAYTTSPTENSTIVWGPTNSPGALTAALRGTIDPPNSGFSMKNGAGQDVAVFRKTAQGLVTPSDVRYIPKGFSSIAQMLATPGATWAHRGNSTKYAEHSLRAYTMAVARGYGILEVSLGRTSDNVWFGLHDVDINRTSGVTGLPPVSQMTWSQVQAYMNTHGSEGLPQPYMTLEQLFDVYGETHSFIIDPKYGWVDNHRAAFWDQVSMFDPDRVMIKFSGPTMSVADEATARGYPSWGFYYQANYNDGSMANTQGPWSTIGMDYTATEAAWDAALSYGKPVIGHIAPNQAAYNIAIQNGASAVLCSASHLISPVSWWNT